MAYRAIHTEPGMRDLKWSGAEKAIARKAFDLALRREFEAVSKKAKHMAAHIEQPTDLWRLENFLTKSREEIDRQYDYRYSVLPGVFADLIHKGRLRDEDLTGLENDKLKYIRE